MDRCAAILLALALSIPVLGCESKENPTDRSVAPSQPETEVHREAQPAAPLLPQPDSAEADLDRLEERLNAYVVDPSAANAELVARALPLKGPLGQGKAEDRIRELIYRQVTLVLESRILAKDRHAFALGLRLEPFTDGASSEILSMALGKFITVDPSGFLEEVAASHPKPSFPHLMAGLGPEYVDQFEKRCEEMLRRKNALLTVTADSLITLRDQLVELAEKYSFCGIHDSPGAEPDDTSSGTP